MRREIFIYVLLVLFGLCTAVVYRYAQPSFDYDINPLADGNEYEKIYDYFRGKSSEYRVRFGIHNRVLIPYAASLMPFGKVEDNFFIVNTLPAVLSLAALFFLLQTFGIERKYAAVALIFYSLHYVGPFRQNALDPINVDMGVYLFEIIFLLLFLRKKYFWMLMLMPAAVAVKEVFLALIPAFLAVSLIHRIWYHDKSHAIVWMICALAVGIITKALLNEFFPSVAPGRNSLVVAAFHLREAVLHPDHVLRWILALFAALGAFLFTAFKYPVFEGLNKNDVTVHILSLAAAVLSFVGGMDYTRLIFLGFPYIILSILKLGRPDGKTLFLAFLLSLGITRFWRRIPLPEGDVTVYNAWMPEYAESSVLPYWVLCVLIFLSVYVGIRFIWRRRTFRSRIVE